MPILLPPRRKHHDSHDPSKETFRVLATRPATERQRTRPLDSEFSTNPSAYPHAVTRIDIYGTEAEAETDIDTNPFAYFVSSPPPTSDSPTEDLSAGISSSDGHHSLLSNTHHGRSSPPALSPFRRPLFPRMMAASPKALRLVSHLLRGFNIRGRKNQTALSTLPTTVSAVNAGNTLAVPAVGVPILSPRLPPAAHFISTPMVPVTVPSITVTSPEATSSTTVFSAPAPLQPRVMIVAPSNQPLYPHPIPEEGEDQSQHVNPLGSSSPSTIILPIHHMPSSISPSSYARRPRRRRHYRYHSWVPPSEDLYTVSEEDVSMLEDLLRVSDTNSDRDISNFPETRMVQSEGALQNLNTHASEEMGSRNHRIQNVEDRKRGNADVAKQLELDGWVVPDVRLGGVVTLRDLVESGSMASGG